MKKPTDTKSHMNPLNHNVTRVRTNTPSGDFILASLRTEAYSPSWSNTCLFVVGMVLATTGCSSNADETLGASTQAGAENVESCEESACTGSQEDGSTAQESPTGEEREEDNSGGNSGARHVGATPTGSPENCSNQIDDDGDGLTDCQDPLCFGKTVCKEQICGDGIDNDFDGLPDCADSDCDFTEDCNPENCASYYDCMVALGCDCTHGLDCPPKETEAYGACQQQCFASSNCRQNCIAALSIETQENIAALQGCVIDCFQDGKGWSECLYGDCLEEFAQCYLVGEATCESFFFECIYGCGGNPTCTENCFGNLSPQGYIDFISWNQCRLEKCDGNGDYAVDSQACSNMAGMYACIEVGGGCIPVQNGGKCSSLIDCVLHCESFEDGPCMASCVEGVGIPEAKRTEVAAVFECFIAICGSGASNLVPSCVVEASENHCKELIELCTKGEEGGPEETP